MARNIRSNTLETRTARLKLPIRKKPTFVRIGAGVGLGYRRNRTAGAWIVRVADGAGDRWTKRIADADDFAPADNNTVLDFWQAQERARSIARGGRAGGADPGRLLTVAEAVDAYEADLHTRGGDVANAARIRLHLPAKLARTTVALLAARDFRPWRAAVSELAPASINRTNNALRAALNLAAEHDERIANSRAWETGLVSIPDAEESRNVILTEKTVRQLVAAAYERVGPKFGILVELAAVTGARYGQLARLEVQDLQAERADPRIMMPASRKGRGRKTIERRPVPIPMGLAMRLAVLAAGRPAEAPLLVKPGGGRWRRSDHTRLFARAVRHAELDGSITVYALRHSNIVRQLLGGVPIRVVAVNHDTSVVMIERTYSRYIGDHADMLSRQVMLDLSEPAGGNVIPLPREG
jgi:integrase